jgi:MoxR-like ATPase
MHQRPSEETKYAGDRTDFYLASPAIADVVNVAIDLKRPILVEGEPGCGKTRLADSIAAEKNLGDVVKITVKSTSRAQDLLYRVNSLRRLQDSQTPGKTDAQYVYPYLSLGPLGRVIHEKKRQVVLIDEIDKADIDFPNDLLDVLDTLSFSIDDLPAEEEEDCRRRHQFGRVVSGDRSRPPIILITSNREKRLPEPFLRRCLYVRVKFPESSDELRSIVRKNTRATASELSEDVLGAAVSSFLAIRQLAVGNTQKPPTTSELIDWVQILHWNGASIESLQSDPLRPPHWSTLFKTMGDLDAYEALAKRQVDGTAT